MRRAEGFLPIERLGKGPGCHCWAIEENHALLGAMDERQRKTAPCRGVLRRVYRSR